MKLRKLSIAVIAFFAFVFFAAPASNAQFGDLIKKTKDKVKDQTKTHEGETNAPTDVKNTGGKTSTKSNSGADDDSDARAENAKKLAKADGMPKPANTDAALNKLLFQAADDVRLIPRKVVVVDKDWLIKTRARDAKVRRIFGVIGRTLDDGSGKCGKQMVQFDQDWKEDKNSWGLIYVQNIGEITPVACGVIGK